MKRYQQVLLVLTLLLGTFWWLHELVGRKPPPLPHVPRPERPVVTVLARVERRDVPRTIEVHGELLARRTSTLSAEVAGTLVELRAPGLGHPVAAGEILALIDADAYEAALREARAREEATTTRLHRQRVAREQTALELRIAEERWQLVQNDLPRMEELHQDGLVTQRALENSRLREAELRALLAGLQRQAQLLSEDEDVARAEREVARASRETAELLCQRTQVRAPYAGHVARRLAEEGDYVLAGTPLLEIVDLTSLRVVAPVPSVHIADLEHGSRATVFVPDRHTSREGRVVEIEPRADPRSRTFDVTIRIDNPPDAPILPGHFAQVSLVLPTVPAALTIPQTALLYRDDRTLVFRLDPERRRVASVPVEVRMIVGDLVLLEGGLEPGDLVAASALDLLFEEALVVPPEQAAAEGSSRSTAVAGS